MTKFKAKELFMNRFGGKYLMKLNVEVTAKKVYVNFMELKDINEMVRVSTVLKVLDKLINYTDFYCPALDEEVTFCKWLSHQLDDSFNNLLRVNIFNTGYVVANEDVRKYLSDWYIELLDDSEYQTLVEYTD